MVMTHNLSYKIACTKVLILRKNTAVAFTNKTNKTTKILAGPVPLFLPFRSTVWMHILRHAMVDRRVDSKKIPNRSINISPTPAPENLALKFRCNSSIPRKRPLCRKKRLPREGNRCPNHRFVASETI